MEFNNLDFKANDKCNCLNNAVEDTTRTYIRRTGDKIRLRNGDFKPELLRPNRQASPATHLTCKDFCKERELSIDCLDGYDEAEILAKHLEVVTPYILIAPDKKYYCAKFKFKQDAGLVKHTPLEGQPSHHDFYRVDSFTVDMIEQIPSPILINTNAPSVTGA